MAAPAVLRIDVIADATKAAAALRDTGDTASGTGSKLMALGKAAATGMAVGAVVEFGKASVTAAVESQKATAGLEQVFRSMGDTTGKAAKSAEDYASALSKKIGVDDDAIIAAQTQLATFGAVSNETARTAGIFDRTTAAAADLAAAGFGSLDSNAVQLGKALQDPVKGLAALGKSGVTFTDQQKAQIKTMVESGDVLGAQKLVLAAVESQVKGTAAATATSGEKMSVAFGEVQESVGAALLPVLEKLAPILVTIADFIQRNISWLLPLAAVLGVLAVAYQIASVASTLFGVSMLAALWPVLLVIAAIAALIAIGVLIVKNWDTIKAAAAAVWQAMQTAWDAILGVIQTAWNWIRTNWPLLLAILTGPIGAAVLLITKNWDTILGAIQGVWNWIRSAWSSVTSMLTKPFTDAWDAISGVIEKVRGVVSEVGTLAGRIVSAVKGPLNGLIRAWNGLEFTAPKVEVFGKTFGGQTIGVPKIPELATGGAVMRTGLAIVHRGETFSGVGRAGGAGVQNVTVNVTTTGLGPDVPELQRAIVNAIRGYTTRNGPLDIPVRSAAF